MENRKELIKWLEQYDDPLIKRVIDKIKKYSQCDHPEYYEGFLDGVEMSVEVFKIKNELITLLNKTKQDAR